MGPIYIWWGYSVYESGERKEDFRTSDAEEVLAHE